MDSPHVSSVRGMPRVTRNAGLAALLTLGLLLSCTDGTRPTGLDEGSNHKVALFLATRFPAGAAGSANQGLPINRIRITATAVPGGEVIAQVVVDVDPTAAQWEVPMEFDLAGVASLLATTNGVGGTFTLGRGFSVNTVDPTKFRLEVVAIGQ